MMVDVSVIIPARNVADLIPAQLNALAQQRTEHTWEVIVADNGSDWFVSGAPDRRWRDAQLGWLKGVPGSAFEVVKMTDLTTG